MAAIIVVVAGACGGSGSAVRAPGTSTGTSTSTSTGTSTSTSTGTSTTAAPFSPPAPPSAEELDVFSRGSSLFEQKRYADAAAEFHRGFELSGRAAFLYNEAVCQEKLRNFERALELYRRYLELNPGRKFEPMLYQVRR